MRSSTLATVAVVFFVQASLGAHGELGPPLPKPDWLWFGLCTQSPIADGREYDHSFVVQIPRERAGSAVPETKLEIRRAKDQAPVIVAAFEPFREAATLPSGISTSDDGLPRDWRERLSFLPEDEYVAAITEAGKRCSNVSGFAVQRDAKTEDRGVLEIVALEPPPYREVPLLGMRVTGSSTLQETFDATAAHYANLTVDGIPRNWTVRVWGGLAPELGVGDRWVMVVDPGGFLLPSIEPGKPHRLKAQVGEYLAEPIDFNPGSPHGEAWDEATRAMLTSENR